MIWKFSAQNFRTYFSQNIDAVNAILWLFTGDSECPVHLFDTTKAGLEYRR